MSKKMFVFALAVVLALSLTLGCAKAPTAKVEEAKAALDNAKSAEANRYLASEYQAAADSLNSANVEIENQNSKFALTRKYDKAVALLDQVIQNSTVLTEKAATRKAEVKAEVEQKIIDVNAVLEETKSLLAKAPRGKEGREALEIIKAEVATAETTVPEINTLITDGDYLTAQDKANAVYDKVSSINQELQDAIAKVKRR